MHVYIYVCVYKTGSGTRLRVTNTTASEQGSTFTNNEASDRGGAIFARAIRTFDIEEAEFTVRQSLYASVECTRTICHSRCVFRVYRQVTDRLRWHHVCVCVVSSSLLMLHAHNRLARAVSQTNFAGVSGGGIFVSRVDTVNNEPVSITGGFFDGNTALFGDGGGIFARGRNGTTTLNVDSRFGNNVAAGPDADVSFEDYSTQTVNINPLV